MEKAKWHIFYSWQSDLPNATNRSFIEMALEKAAKSLRADDSIEVEPVIDRDTNGVPGSPDIAGTIFNKIDQSQVFVCDVSLINQGSTGRLVPNPNVLIELGYAMKALEAKRIILVFNDAYGNIESLPFDLRTRRVIQYTASVENKRADERTRLEQTLTKGLRTIIDHLDTTPPGEIIKPSSPAEQALIAVKERHPDQDARIRDYMMALAKNISLMLPTNTNDEPDEQLTQVINTSTDLVIEFARVTKEIIEKKSDEAAEAMYSGFGDILNLYTIAPQDGHRGNNTYASDLAKFLGHELFVTFFSFLIQNKRWNLVEKLLDEDLYARVSSYSSPELVPYTSLCEPVNLLFLRNKRLGLQSSLLHAKMLYERHSTGEIANLVPIENFIEADYFLLQRNVLQPSTLPQHIAWRAWSTVYMKQPARFLKEATRREFAQQLAFSLGLPDVLILRNRLSERKGVLTEMWNYGFNSPWFDPNVEQFDIDTIGKR